MERLQKIIAEAGIASRRKAEELIKEGKVRVNGKVITEMGYKASKHDEIYVSEKPISKEAKVYLVMNKPRSIISSVNDEHDRHTVIDILPSEFKKYRLFPVGRLDYDTKGVILITNDGDFMNNLIGPKSFVQKEYLARVKGSVKAEDIRKLESGIKVDNYVTRPALAEILEVDRKNGSTLVRIIITEGKNHQVKKMFETIGYPVKKLSRIRFGCIEINNLPVGAVRKLSIHEVKQLYQLSQKPIELKREDVSKYRKM